MAAAGATVIKPVSKSLWDVGGTVQALDVLAAYLDRYLPRTDCYYDQGPAIGALLHLDERLGIRHADRFITSGLWQASAFSDQDPADHHQATRRLCAAIDMSTRGRTGGS